MPLTNPPRPHCAFRVAAIGHRWDQLAHENAGAIRGRFHDVLTTVTRVATDVASHAASGFDTGAPVLTLLSGLAEGTDRLAADASLRVDGWRLHAVAPFELKRYEQDFPKAESLEEFRHLWHAAATRTVLDGPVGEFDAYTPLARVLVDFSDLLIVVWNGERGRGPGGTASSVENARLADIPIVRIDPAHPHTCWLEDLAAEDHGRARGLANLDQRLRQLLSAPAPASGSGDARSVDLCAEYFAESIPRGDLPRNYDRLIGLLQRGDAARARTWSTAHAASDPGEATRTAWQSHWNAVPAELTSRVLESFAEAHGWADQLATVYAARFRRTFTSVFFLAPIAVVAAYAGAVGFDKSVARFSAVGVIEIAILIYISWLVRSGRRQRLRERWLDYRALAERLRHLAVLWPVLRTTPMVRVPPPGVRNDSRLSWVGWLLRCVAREAGLPGVVCTPAYAEACRRLLREAEIAPQRAFHSSTQARSARVQHALATIAERFFMTAVVLALVHLMIGTFGPSWRGDERGRRTVEMILAGCCVALPAMAASIHGFLGIGDFAGIAVRSAGIEPRLAQIEERLGRLDPADVTGVGLLGIEATTLMETELATWRTVAETRELETP